MSERKPRFKRVPTAGFAITERDLALVRAVHAHRLLDSEHLAALVGGSSQQIRRRLQLLFHNRYLDRPPVQRSDRYQSGSTPMIYALGNRGADLLAERDGIPRGGIDWSAKNRGVKERFMEHTLLTASIMVAFELGCRARGTVRVIPWSEILREKCPAPTQLKARPMSWQVKIPGKGTMGITPDGIFGLEFLDRPEGKNKVFFFLEADRGTMPVERENLAQTSIRKKLLLYHATYSAGLQTSLFGMKYFRVLVVTSKPERVETMVTAAKKLPSLHGLFLFASLEGLEKGDPMGEVWRDGRGDAVGV